MTLALIRVIMIAGVVWFSYSLLRSGTAHGSSLRWYDRTIHLLGAILMFALAIGGLLLLTGKLH